MTDPAQDPEPVFDPNAAFEVDGLIYAATEPDPPEPSVPPQPVL